MLRSFALTVVACLFAGSPVFAERIITVTVQRNGKEVLRTEYAVEADKTDVDIWRDYLQKEPRDEPSVVDFSASEKNPLKAKLTGAVSLKLSDGDKVIGEAKLESLLLQRKDATTQKWYLDEEEVYRTAFEAGVSDQYSRETYFQRLGTASEPAHFEFNGKTYDGYTWLFVLIPVLVVGAIFIVWMYIKDSRSIKWYICVPLALCRGTVYGLLAYMFLLPTVKETRIWKPRTPPVIIKNSRVVVLLDVSESMRVSDDPSKQSNRTSRLEKIINYLSDENVNFLKNLLKENPVYLYRFASRLDSEVHAFTLDKEKGEIRPFVERRNEKNSSLQETVKLAKWGEKDWYNFAHFSDFKSAVVRGLSDEARIVVEADMGPADEIGNVAWADKYIADKAEVIVARMKLPEKDAGILRGNLNNLDARIALARTIAQGTNVTEAVQTAFDAEKDNKLMGIFVFSDGKSNIGVDTRSADSKDEVRMNPALETLHRAAKKNGIPIITIGIGEHRVIKSVRFTDLQPPSQTPPDDPFKINVEFDAENMPGESFDIALEMYPPNSETPFLLPGKLTVDRGEPAHGQFDWTINPADILEKVPADMHALVMNGKELVEGLWYARAVTAKVNEDGKPDPKEKVYSEKVPIRIIKKSVRILVMCNAPNRDFQFLVNQLIRDKAEISVYVQNEAGQFLDGKSITYLDDKYRHLSRFPDYLKVDYEADAEEKQETKWYNLARYDVIIAFDPDWSLLTDTQATLIQTWVDLQAGGLLHIGGPVNTKKMTWNENAEKLAPLLEVFPVVLGDYDLKMANRDRNKPRRLDFPGAGPEMEFLRLDDDDPENLLSGWEPFFTGKKTKEAGLTSELKNGFYDYYPVKDVKAGATIVARYVEPNANENTFDRKDPPYMVTYKYGQGWSAFLGSSEIWRFNKYKSVYSERFWVKMSRFLASGSRKKQNNRGRVLMAKQYYQGDYLRSTIQYLGPDLKGIPASSQPEVTMKPIELESYDRAGLKNKEGAPPKKEGEISQKEKDDIHKSLTRIARVTARKDGRGMGGGGDDGYFQLQYLLTAANFPPGVWAIETKIPNSSESLTEKFLIRKALPPELSDVKPDMLSLAAISAEVDELRQRLVKKPEVLEKLRSRSFAHPTLNGQRLAFKFDDKASIELLPESMPGDPQEIVNPQTEPEVKKSKIEPRWFNGPNLPRWMTRWYDKWMGQTERTHNVALWMLVVVSLLSVEWLTRKLLKLA